MDTWIGQHYCLVSLLCGACLGVWGLFDYSQKDHKAAYRNWIWGGFASLPGVLCALAKFPVRFLVVIGLLTLAAAILKQSRWLDRTGTVD